MSVNEAVVISVREDGALVVKRNLEAMGAAGTTASKGIDRVKLALGEMTTRIQSLSPAISSMQAKIGIATGVLGNMVKSARDSGSAFAEILNARDNVDALRASLDPAYAAQMKFNQSFDLLESALASGAIKMDQYSASLELLIRDYSGADAAARELAATKAALQSKVDSLRASYDPLFASSKRYEAAVDTLDAALAAGIIKTQQYETALEQLGQQYLVTGAQSKSLGVASANTANLFAQFNDIAVMLAAGQNPVQLAMQQGTQISQVLTDISTAGGGLKGMLSALGAGLMSMVNPITLLTIGIIGFGAAAFNWLTTLIPETVSLKDRLDALSDAVQKYSMFASLAAGTTTELQGKFGTAGGAIGKAAQLLSQFTQVAAVNQMKTSLQTLSEEFGGFSRTALTASYSASGAGGVMKEIDATMLTLKENFSLTTQQAANLTLALAAMSNAQNPQDAIIASQTFQEVLLQIYGTAEKVPLKFQEMAIAAGQVAMAGGEILSAEEKIAAARQRNLTMQMQVYANSRMASNAAQAEANVLLKTYQDQTRMQQLIAQYGENSVQVTKARQAAELQVLQAQVNQLDVSQSIKDEIMAAARATDSAINATNAWAGAMAGVAAQIRGIMAALSGLAGTMIGNASKAVEIAALKSGKTIAEARIAATKYEIETEGKAREMAAGNMFERGLVWLDKKAKLRAVDMAEELTGLQAIAAERERAANAGSSGGSAGGSAGGTPKLSDQMKLENKLLDEAIGEREQFVQKLEAVNNLLAQGSAAYTKTDAFNELSGMIGSDIFAGTQEAIDAQIARFRTMYEQIDMMRQADIISEKSAAQAKLAVDAQYGEMRLKHASAVFGQLASLSSSNNRTLAAIGKAAAVTQATIDGVLAIQKALAASPPPFNYAMAAAIGVTTAANVAQILSTNANFATGGSFVVGGSGGVDSQMVSMRASPGERVTVQTPQQVRKGSEAAQLGTSGGAAAPQVNIRQITLVDPALLGDYLATAEGEDLLMTTIRRNKDQLTQVFQNG